MALLRNENITGNKAVETLRISFGVEKCPEACLEPERLDMSKYYKIGLKLTYTDKLST